jgi:hypothetical protein
LRQQKERISAGFLDESSAMKKLEEVILQKDIEEIRNTEFKNYDQNVRECNQRNGYMVKASNLMDEEFRMESQGSSVANN